MYSVVFAGSAEIGLPTLQALLGDDRFSVEAVVTQPARPRGRKGELELTPIGKFAEAQGVPLSTAGTKAELDELIKTLPQPDFLIVVAYGVIVSVEVLQWPNVAPINVHVSLLPKYRGASPIQSALLNGDQVVGNSYMQMDEGLDTGPVYMQTKLQLNGTELADQVSDQLAALAAEDLPDLLVKIAEGSVESKPQIGDGSVCGKIRKSDGEIVLSEMTAEQIWRKYRAFTPWPGVFTFFDQQRVLLVELAKADFAIPCGEIELVGDHLLVGTKDGALEFKRVRPAGKQEMSAVDWYRGFANK